MVDNYPGAEHITGEELGNNLSMIAIVTDKNLRYSRLEKREIRPLTNEEAKARDLAEIENMNRNIADNNANTAVFL